MYGNASFDTSASVTACSTSRARGPHSPSANSEPVRSVIATTLAVADLRTQPREVVLAAPAARHDAEQLLVLARHGEVAAGSRRVGVSIAVYTIEPTGPVDPVGEHPLEEGAARRARRRRTSRTA